MFETLPVARYSNFKCTYSACVLLIQCIRTSLVIRLYKRFVQNSFERKKKKKKINRDEVVKISVLKLSGNIRLLKSKYDLVDIDNIFVTFISVVA